MSMRACSYYRNPSTLAHSKEMLSTRGPLYSREYNSVSSIDLPLLFYWRFECLDYWVRELVFPNSFILLSLWYSPTVVCPKPCSTTLWASGCPSLHPSRSANRYQHPHSSVIILRSRHMISDGIFLFPQPPIWTSIFYLYHDHSMGYIVSQNYFPR